MAITTQSRRPARSSQRQPRLRPLLAALALGLLITILAFILWRLRPQSTTPTYLGPVEHVASGGGGAHASLLFIAQDQGFFRTHGLDVTVTNYDSGPPALADLLSGKLDTAMAADFAGVRNSFNGEDLKILATMSKSDAFSLIVRTDHGLHQAADLKGKKIGVTRKTVGEFYLGQYLTFNNLKLSDITIVDQPQATLRASVAAGTIDAAVLFEPSAYQARNRLGAQGAAWAIQSGQSIYSLLYTTGAFVQAHPNISKRYLAALIQAEQYLQDHATSARAIIARRLHYDNAYISYMWPKFQFDISLDQELLINMDDEARWAIENHLTTSTQVPNYLRLIDLEPLNTLDPRRITIIR